jgi:hypothetical protein
VAGQELSDSLENALTFSDSPGLKMLRRKIEQKLEELDSIEYEQM